MMMQYLGDGDKTEYSPPPDQALNVYNAVFDSGSTSHLLKPSCLPTDSEIYSSKGATIRTALSDSTMPAFGRVSPGILTDSLVVSDNLLTKNLVSIPKLDRAGYTTIFGNGEAAVTDRDGNVIARAPLKHSDLYEFDIRQLFNQVETSLLGSALLDDNDITTWHLR